MMKKLVSAFVILLLPLGASAEPKPVSSGVTYELIGTYDVERLNRIVTTELQEFTPTPVRFPEAKYAVKLYRISYPSVIPEQQNRPTIASGLLAVPELESRRMPVVSYQHGTVFTKTAVPSHPDESMETRLILAQFAGQGYAVVGADYFGKGLSSENDSYLVKGSTQQACLDHLQAARAVSNDLGIEWDALFLSGWSQGGWATLCFQEKLESIGVTVKAVAAASAPADIYAAINGWLKAPRQIDAVYLPAILALQINAYAEYYQLPGLADTAIRPEYRETARDFYLNRIDWATAYEKLPSKVSELLAEDFMAAGAKADTPYWQLAQEAEVYRWRSMTPTRIYFGQADEVVAPYIANLPVAYQKAVGGAAIEAVDAGETANHRQTFVFGVADQKKWFDSLLDKEAAANGSN